MRENYEKNVAEIKKTFFGLSAEQRYSALIELGKALPPYPQELKTLEKLVQGCQSTLYLHTYSDDSKIYFTIDSEALISKGLAALLVKAYQGLPPQALLTLSPTFLQELGILTSLSLNRSNGLAHIHLKMKQDAIKEIKQNIVYK